ncbi:Fic family protein [Nocardia stercoris]|uniref:Fic family protein n=1 Tax=Nocardia stercoris TaxID=2483361 RepID=A0A3M2L8R3_9NOCA|nr:Fic/DOC family N-terminal domain-containing protein [Nocardia stercoris]RMI30958.1 Fic family protein [Nocardia stercoris]
MTTWRPDMPYNDLPAVPRDQMETHTTLKAAIAANKALAKLDQAAKAMPNPTVLINTIPLLEAQASSEIENIVTTTDALFRHVEDEANADGATRETLRYRRALRIGYDHIHDRGLTTSTAIEVCSTIKGREMALRSLPGTRIANPATGAVIYSPPEGRDIIATKMGEWEHFIHTNDDIDALIVMAAAHYQFEAIHPFTDGNGRTGRILNVLMLCHAGLLHLPVLYLSRYIIDTKKQYYRCLSAVTAESAWEPWLLYILEGVTRTSEATVRKIDDIRNLQDDFAARARAATKGGADSEFQAALFEQPYCRIATVMDRCNVSRPTATKWLATLADAGMLHDRRVGKDRLFINREFLQVLTA